MAKHNPSLLPRIGLLDLVLVGGAIYFLPQIKDLLDQVTQVRQPGAQTGGDVTPGSHTWRWQKVTSADGHSSQVLDMGQVGIWYAALDHIGPAETLYLDVDVTNYWLGVIPGNTVSVGRASFQTGNDQVYTRYTLTIPAPNGNYNVFGGVNAYRSHFMIHRANGSLAGSNAEYSL